MIIILNKLGYNYLNESCTIYNQDLSSNNISEDKFKLENSLNPISMSFNSLNIADSCETVASDMSCKHMSVAHKSQVIGRSHARRIKMN